MDFEEGKRACGRADVVLRRFLKSASANGDPYGELEKMVVDLAETFSNPEEFGAALETLAPVFLGIFYKKEEQIGIFPFLVGVALSRLSYPDLASKSEDVALRYFIKFDNKNMIETLQAKRRTLTTTETSNRESKTLSDLPTIGETPNIDWTTRSDFLRFKFFSLANDYQRLENSDKATRYYKKSLKIAREIGDKILEAKCRALLARVPNLVAHEEKRVQDVKSKISFLKERNATKGFLRPEQKLEYDISKKMESGKTREEAIEELYEEVKHSD